MKKSWHTVSYTLIMPLVSIIATQPHQRNGHYPASTYNVCVLIFKVFKDITSWVFSVFQSYEYHAFWIEVNRGKKKEQNNKTQDVISLKI